MDWNIHLKPLMGEAAQLVRGGQLAEATRVIQQALGGAVHGWNAFFGKLEQLLGRDD